MAKFVGIPIVSNEPLPIVMPINIDTICYVTPSEEKKAVLHMANGELVYTDVYADEIEDYLE